MEPTNQTYDYQNAGHNVPHTALKVAGLSALVVALIVGVSLGVVLTKREAANQASAATSSAGTVAISQGAFTPDTIKVKKGQGVTWTNLDGRRGRQVIAGTDNASQSLRGFGTDDPLTKGESYSYVFEQVGTFHYYDSTTSQTIGTVIVTE